MAPSFRFWHKADRLKRCEVCYERKVDAHIALTGVRYFKVGRLLNTLPRFANDFLTIHCDLISVESS